MIGLSYCTQFRANYLTETATYYIIVKAEASVDKGSVVGAMFLDLQKALDTVNHNILMYKLHNCHFSTDIFNLTKSPLSKWITVHLTHYFCKLV